MRDKKVKFLDEDLVPSPYHERIICCHMRDMDVQRGDSMELVNCVDDDDDDNDDELDNDDDGEDTHTPFKFGQKDAEQ
jgi:hypothetical protein